MWLIKGNNLMETSGEACKEEKLCLKKVILKGKMKKKTFIQ